MTTRSGETGTMTAMLVLAATLLIGVVSLAIFIAVDVDNQGSQEMTQEHEGHFDPAEPESPAGGFGAPGFSQPGFETVFDPVGGRSRVVAVSQPGFAIRWEGDSAARPIDILESCARRMQYMQQTPMGSDENARALFAVMQAIDHLQGTDQVSATIED